VSRRRPFLGEWAVTPATLKRYRDQVLSFVQWQRANGEFAVSESDMDDVLLAYIHDLYEGGRGKSVASHTLYGIYTFMPELKGCLPRSQQAVRGWNKRVVGRSYPPLTWELASALAVQLARDPLHRRHAVGVLLSFDCLLRVGELVQLRREDIAHAHDQRLGTGGGRYRGPGTILRIQQAKTGKNQWVTVRDPQVIRMLLELRAMTKPGALLFPFSTASFRAVFKRGCADLKLSSLYVPHSLRHGGATRYRHVLGWSMENVIERGRWASAKSARIYIQAGVALLMSMAAPRGLVELGNDLSNHLFEHIFLFLSLTQ